MRYLKSWLDSLSKKWKVQWPSDDLLEVKTLEFESHAKALRFATYKIMYESGTYTTNRLDKTIIVHRTPVIGDLPAGSMRAIHSVAHSKHPRPDQPRND